MKGWQSRLNGGKKQQKVRSISNNDDRKVINVWQSRGRCRLEEAGKCQRFLHKWSSFWCNFCWGPPPLGSSYSKRGGQSDNRTAVEDSGRKGSSGSSTTKVPASPLVSADRKKSATPSTVRPNARTSDMTFLTLRFSSYTNLNSVCCGFCIIGITIYRHRSKKTNKIHTVLTVNEPFEGYKNISAWTFSRNSVAT